MVLPALLATGCSASLWVLLMGAPSSSCFQNHVLPFLLPLCLQGKILEKQNTGERRPWPRWMQKGAVGTELLYQQETHPQRPVLHPTGHQPPCLRLCEQEGLDEIGVQMGWTRQVEPHFGGGRRKGTEEIREWVGNWRIGEPSLLSGWLSLMQVDGVRRVSLFCEMGGCHRCHPSG